MRWLRTTTCPARTPPRISSGVWALASLRSSGVPLAPAPPRAAPKPLRTCTLARPARRDVRQLIAAHSNGRICAPCFGRADRVVRVAQASVRRAGARVLRASVKRTIKAGWSRVPSGWRAARPRWRAVGAASSGSTRAACQRRRATSRSRSPAARTAFFLGAPPGAPVSRSRFRPRSYSPLFFIALSCVLNCFMVLLYSKPLIVLATARHCHALFLSLWPHRRFCVLPLRARLFRRRAARTRRWCRFCRRRQLPPRPMRHGRAVCVRRPAGIRPGVPVCTRLPCPFRRGAAVCSP